MVSFFETLRIELGPSVKITIVAPGFIRTDMSLGKCLSKEGKIIFDKKAGEFLARTRIPLCDVECSAKAIVDGAARGDRYLMEPPWLKAAYLLKLCNPDLSNWVQRLIVVDLYSKIM
ncbi:hypothetical protein Nepgr_033340 [Nepenthes gracilis]|uniref:Uncharacterized protein n=1 Tax=Nepenthes gracilis TaxID=150966 RepID=A0AAD3Y6I1_NEPGR|nr:hypothetical protein Nepgr_033340 [Nepenthes gracilis]